MLGTARPLWERLTGLAERLKTKSDLKMYGPSYGWMVCFRRAGRLLFSLYPARDALIAQIVLHQNQVDAAAGVELQPATRAIMKAAKQYPEGRWLFIPVLSEADAADVERLAEAAEERGQEGVALASAEAAGLSLWGATDSCPQHSVIGVGTILTPRPPPSRWREGARCHSERSEESVPVRHTIGRGADSSLRSE